MTPHPTALERSILALIVLAYVALGSLYALLTPPWQVPDEPAHYNYIRHLVEKRRLPVLEMGDYDQAYLEQITDDRFSPSYSIDPIRYEFHQPPLYYALLAPVYALFRGALVPLRLCSVLLGAGVLIVAYLIAKELYPDRAWPALGTVAFVAFVPQHIAMTSGVENDVLAELLLAIILLRLVRWLQSSEHLSWRSHALTGAFIGLGLLTKMSAYIAVPLAILAAALRFWRKSPSAQPRLDTRQALQTAVALLLPALLIVLPWFVRNAAIYGGLDVTGLQRHDRVVQGQLRTSEWIERFGWANLPGTFSRTTFRSFWAQFGWMAVPIDWRIYTALRMLSAVAAVGFIFRAVDAWEDRHWPSSALLVLLGSGVLTLGTYLWYNLGFYQAQGRYLFPALIPLGLAWTLGWKEVLHPRNAWWAGGVLAIVTGYDIVQLFRSHGEKWKILIHGMGSAFVGGRLLLPASLESWLLAIPYGFLAAVCAVSPFWFIVPHLTP
jgi:4-amino-4-deoxy-L-arabinose transferase-like glycosyltransferase